MQVFDRLRSFQDWRVRTRFLALVVPLVVVLTGLAVLGVYLRDTSNLETKVMQRAHSISTQIISDRKYYTAVVVPRLVELGGSLGDDYASVPGRFPLPATLVREVSELTANANDGFTSNLISPWPINKAKGLTDQFQKDAFVYLQNHPYGQFFRTDQIAGQEVLRFITADRATVRSCADCHNADPRSPKHDFHLDDVMGGLEIVIPIEQYVKQVRQDLAMTVIGFTGLSLVMVGVIAVGARQAFVRPLNKLTAKVEQFLGGQDGVPRSVESTGTRNEIQRLDQHCRRMQDLIAKQQTQLQLAAAQQETRARDRVRALLEAQEQLNLPVNYAGDAVIYLDSDGTILWANHQGSEVLGRPAESVTGQSVLTLLSPESAALARTRLEAARRDQPLTPATFDVLRPNGTTVRIEVQGTSVHDGPRVTGRLVVMRPV